MPDPDLLLARFGRLVPQASAIRIAMAPVADHRADLHELELPAIDRAAERRANEFSTGRVLARRAMRALGLPPAPVARGDGRAPRWPAGCIGSITHAEHLAAAAVAPPGALRGIGIDLERSERVGAHLYPKLFTARELAELDAWQGSRARQGTLRFSAKEAVYKAVHPSVGRFIGFREVEVVVEAEAACASARGDRTEPEAVVEAGRFRLRYVGEHAPNRIMEAGTGCYCYFEQYVFTLFMIP